MTYEIVCSKCGHTIYSGFDLRRPDDILRPFGHRCRKCGVTLDLGNFKVDVMKREEPLQNFGGRSDQSLPMSNALHHHSESVKDPQVISA